MLDRLYNYALIFLCGIFLTLSVVYFAEWRYEEDVLESMIHHIKLTCKNCTLADKVEKAMNLTHQVVDPMADIYGDENFGEVKNLFISPSFLVFYYGKGACGGYSTFTARLLNEMNIKTKFVQQNVNGVPGGHITLVLEENNKLLLVDPLFNWSFRDTMGNMTDIHDVAANWAYFRRHKPKIYGRKYNYQGGWTFTNWDKYGSFSRAIYHVGAAIWGKARMDNVSLHNYLLGATKKNLFICLTFFIIFTAMLVRRMLQFKTVYAAGMPIQAILG